MNLSLLDALQQLNLQPGTYRCDLPEHEVVVQVRPRKVCEDSPSVEDRSTHKNAEPETIDESCIMLEPWIELPSPEPIGTVVGRLAPPPPPDIPYIPTEEEMT